VALQQYFLHPRLVDLMFPISPIKLKMGLQKGERLPIATHLYQPSNLDNQQQVVLGAVTFGSQSILVKNAILLSQTIIF
jgi:hypothetical protein